MHTPPRRTMAPWLAALALVACKTPRPARPRDAAAPPRAASALPRVRDGAVDVAAPDAAVVAPLRIDTAVAAHAPAAFPSTLRALLVEPPMEARGGGAQYVPMLCYDTEARRVVPSPQCAARVPASATVTFPSGATAHIARRAALPCEYSAAYDSDPWHPMRGQPGQPGLVLDGPMEPREPFTLWPAGIAWSFRLDEAEAGLPDRFEVIPQPERAALWAVTHAPADAPPEVIQLVSVDLDGDGARERIYNLRFTIPTADPENSFGPTTEVCVVAGAGAGTPQCFGDWQLRDPKIAAALDLDGDGALEILMYVPGNDFTEYSLWRREGGAWRSLGSSNCS